MIERKLSSQYASPFRRFAAIFYDCFVLFSFWILATALALALNHGESLAPHQSIFLFYLFCVTGLFCCFFWHKKGQTLGMLAWKICVVNEDNSPLSWGQALQRYLWSWVSFSLCGLGFFWCLLDKKNQMLHDKLAKTKVLKV